MENNFPREKGLMGRIDERPRWPFYDKPFPIASKIIFLNKANLAEFEGYKASIELTDGLFDHAEIHIVLTGFSLEAARNLYNKLKPLPKKEIHGA